jgi:hypothetical protein
MNRNSQREKVTIAEHDIYSSELEPFYEMFPEPYGNSVFADAVSVLVGCYKNEEHLRWILEKGKYNIRLGGEREGSIELKESYLKARYLLLYNLDDFSDLRIMKIIKEHPTIANDTAMAEMGYPDPTPNQMYMVYDVSVDAVEPELSNRPWTIEPFVKDKDGAPIIVTYTNLFPE